LLCRLLVRRLFTCLALFATSSLAPLRADAQTAVLLAVGDATQLSELQLAKVMADDSSLWLSAHLQGRTRLALVTAESEVESAPAAHAWLGALDFATRMRVAAPAGNFSGCGSLMPFALADSGLPEPRRLAALELSREGSELELRRRLADAGLPVEISRVAQFTSQVQPPYRVAIYDAPAFGGSTETLRLLDRGHAGQLPHIVLSGAQSLPLSLIALAKEGVLPVGQASADPSEFPVAYRAADTDSDYVSARRGWLARNPTGWLNEVQASAALFAATVFPQGGQIEPVVSRYFGELSGASAGTCETQIRAAHGRASTNAADFVCNGAEDLALSLTEVGFEELRLSRFFGMLSGDGGAFQVASGVPRGPLLQATDFDGSGCPPAPALSLPPYVASEAPDSRTPPDVGSSPGVVSSPDAPVAPAVVGSPYNEGSCTVFAVDSGSSDSCSGDTRSGDTRSDSCSGDTSSGDTRSDSCSGDTSSGDSGPDSCSGDSSDASSDGCSGDSDSRGDSSGCGKSEYDGDTCSGSSASGNAAKSSSASLRPGNAPRAARPRHVRLSLLTLLAAALALPLRRLRASR
jgi:hypothetical protein